MGIGCSKNLIDTCFFFALDELDVFLNKCQFCMDSFFSDSARFDVDGNRFNHSELPSSRGPRPCERIASNDWSMRFVTMEAHAKEENTLQIVGLFSKCVSVTVFCNL